MVEHLLAQLSEISDDVRDLRDLITRIEPPAMTPCVASGAVNTVMTLLIGAAVLGMCWYRRLDPPSALPKRGLAN